MFKIVRSTTGVVDKDNKFVGFLHSEEFRVPLLEHPAPLDINGQVKYKNYRERVYQAKLHVAQEKARASLDYKKIWLSKSGLKPFGKVFANYGGGKDE